MNTKADRLTSEGLQKGTAGIVLRRRKSRNMRRKDSAAQKNRNWSEGKKQALLKSQDDIWRKLTYNLIDWKSTVLVLLQEADHHMHSVLPHISE